MYHYAGISQEFLYFLIPYFLIPQVFHMLHDLVCFVTDILPLDITFLWFLSADVFCTRRAANMPQKLLT